jgi:integrase
MLFNFAEARRYAAHNPARHVKKLRTPADADAPLDQNVLTPTELQKLIAVTDSNWRAAIAVLGYGGLRLGELGGLQWVDVELERCRIYVRRQLDAISGTFREPKTRAGTRFVELPNFVVRELRAWKIRCPPGELCFPTGDGRPMDQRNFRSRVFEPALRRAGLRRIRVHDLRHSAASMMIATGADLAGISRQLGHANVNITLTTYTHWFAKRTSSGIGAKLEELVARETGCEMVAPEGNAVLP